MVEAASDIKYFIALDKRYVSIFLLVGLSLVIVGVLGISGIFSLAVTINNETVNTAIKALGILVTLIGFFPFNSAYFRWERIQTLHAMERNPTLDSENKKELLYKLYAKFLGVL
jgi:hypothetical protein